MIVARRRDVEEHVARHGLPFATDPSNRDPRFLRTRVRYELLPVLERMSPRIVEHLCSLADDYGKAGPPKPVG
jgi:tRNA(Ile)-lysidine synthase